MAANKRDLKASGRKVESVHAGHRERLRESARRDYDLNGLRDVELIELLLSFFIPRKDTNVLAHKLIDKFGSAVGVLCASKAELMLFPEVTARVAALLPLLGNVCTITDGDIAIKTRRDGAGFFGSVFAGSGECGTYAAYLDEAFKVIAIERLDGEHISRDILCSLCKYDGKYVFAVRRERDMFPPVYDLAAEVGALAEMIASVGGRLLDFLTFTDYGYYTIGEPPKTEGWYPLYVFVPIKRFMYSPELYNLAAGEFADEMTAESVPDILTQLKSAAHGFGE